MRIYVSIDGESRVRGSSLPRSGNGQSCSDTADRLGFVHRAMYTPDSAPANCILLFTIYDGYGISWSAASSCCADAISSRDIRQSTARCAAREYVTDRSFLLHYSSSEQIDSIRIVVIGVTTDENLKGVSRRIYLEGCASCALLAFSAR